MYSFTKVTNVSNFVTNRTEHKVSIKQPNCCSKLKLSDKIKLI